MIRQYRYKETGTLFFYDREIPKDEYLNGGTHIDFKWMTNLQALIQTFDYAKFGLENVNPSAHLKASLAWAGEAAHEQDSSMLAINKALVRGIIDTDIYTYM
jgi:hypothetical protein